MKKRILALAMAVAMLVGVMPVSAVAADNVAEVDGTEYDTLQKAIDAATSGGTVKLLDNIAANEQIIIKKSLTLDLGEFTITGNIAGDGLVRISAPDANTAINVTINATTGGIKTTGNSIPVYAGLIDIAKTNVTINGGCYESSWTNGFGAIYQNNGLCTINGGSFKAANSERLLDNYDGSEGAFMISGGTFYQFNPACLCINQGDHHDHDSIAAGKTTTYANSWYTVVDGESNLVAQVESIYDANDLCYNSLQDAINAAKAEDGDKVILVADTTVTDSVVINKSLTLDLGGYTITGNADEPVLRIYSDVVDTEIAVTIDATTGGIVNEGTGYAIYAGEDLNGGNDAERTNLTINGGNYETAGTDCIKQIMGLCTINNGTYKSSFGRTVLNGKQWYGAEFAINGGSFYGFNPACVSVWTGFDGKDYDNYYHQHDIIADGKTAEFNNGWYTVTDGEYTPVAKTKSLCFGSVGEALNAVVAMKDIRNLGIITLLADATLSVDDSKIATASYDESGNYLEEDQLGTDLKFSFVLNGHDLTLPAGYKLYDATLEDNTKVQRVTTAVYVAEVNGTGYETLSEAVNAAQETDTIKLVADIEISAETLFEMAEGVTLDLNGYTIKAEDAAMLLKGENITVKNGTITGINKKDYYPLTIEGGSATLVGLTVENAGIKICNSAVVSMEDNTIKANQDGFKYAVWAYGKAKVAIKSGTYFGGKNGYDVFEEGKANITLYGGTYKVKNNEGYVATDYRYLENADGTFTVAPKHVHAYNNLDWNMTYHWYVCSCGDKIDMALHTYGDWYTVQYATTWSTGTARRNCVVCSDPQSKEIPKLSIEVQPNVNNPVVSLKYLNTQDHIAYIKGYEDATIRPNNTITRAEVATIFYRLLTDEARAAFETAVNGFSDVNAKDWFNVAVSTLDNADIIKDVKNGKFRPNEPITRAELFVMAAQFVQLTGGKVPVTYIPDVADDHWAADEIKLLIFADLLKGYEDGSIRPDNTLTRAEAITVINRMLKRAITEEALPEVMVTFIDCTVADWFYEAVQEAVNGHEYIRSTDKVEGYDYNYEIWTSLK